MPPPKRRLLVVLRQELGSVSPWEAPLTYHSLAYIRSFGFSRVYCSMWRDLCDLNGGHLVWCTETRMQKGVWGGGMKEKGRDLLDQWMRIFGFEIRGSGA